MIGPETTSWGVGPISIDVAMARRHGWSDASIKVAADVVRKLSIQKSDWAHWCGPVKGCPCCVCDLTTRTEDLPDESYRLTRARWAQNAGGVVNGAAE